MTYESTGEIRKPLPDEYYLSFGLSQQLFSREVYRYCLGDDAAPHIEWKRIIMKPLPVDYCENDEVADFLRREDESK